MEQVLKNLNDLELMIDQLKAHLIQENSQLPSIKPAALRALIQQKEVLSQRYDTLVGRLFSPHITYDYKAHISKELREKIIELNLLLKDNERLVKAVRGARESFIDVVKKVVTQHQRPHAKLYNQSGIRQGPPRRRLNVSLAMNYCY